MDQITHGASAESSKHQDDLDIIKLILHVNYSDLLNDGSDLDNIFLVSTVGPSVDWLGAKHRKDTRSNIT